MLLLSELQLPSFEENQPFEKQISAQKWPSEAGRVAYVRALPQGQGVPLTVSPGRDIAPSRPRFRGMGPILMAPGHTRANIVLLPGATNTFRPGPSSSREGVCELNAGTALSSHSWAARTQISCLLNSLFLSPLPDPRASPASRPTMAILCPPGPATLPHWTVASSPTLTPQARS